MTEEKLDRFLQQHSQTSLSISELLSKFLEGPASTSQEVAIQSRIRRAAFPTDATLESYDWTRNPKTIRKETFLELATGQFIARKENAAFVGLSGLGKTHLIQGVVSWFNGNWKVRRWISGTGKASSQEDRRIVRRRFIAYEQNREMGVSGSKLVKPLTFPDFGLR